MDEIKITYPRGWKVKIKPKPPMCRCCFDEEAEISGMCQECYDIVHGNPIALFRAWWDEDDDKEEDKI